jgi:hypothetical protein
VLVDPEELHRCGINTIHQSPATYSPPRQPTDEALTKYPRHKHGPFCSPFSRVIIPYSLANSHPRLVCYMGYGFLFSISTPTSCQYLRTEVILTRAGTAICFVHEATPTSAPKCVLLTREGHIVRMQFEWLRRAKCVITLSTRGGRFSVLPCLPLVGVGVLVRRGFGVGWKRRRSVGPKQFRAISIGQMTVRPERAKLWAHLAIVVSMRSGTYRLPVKC